MNQLKIKPNSFETNEGYIEIKDKHLKKMKKKLEEDNPDKEVRTVFGNIGFTVGRVK